MSKITWYVKTEDELSLKDEYHAGTFQKDEKVSIDLQVWNNRWGVQDEPSISVPVLNFYFNHYEDQSMIELCSVFIEDQSMPIIIKGNKGTVILDRELAGRANDGKPDSADNVYNFVNIQFEVNTVGKALKENDLKKLYFEIKELM